MSDPKPDIQPLVERIYDIVVAPDRLEHLLDSWTDRLRDSTLARRYGLFHESAVAAHIERAEVVLRQLLEVEGRSSSAADQWAAASRAAALVTTRAGTVIASNAGARASLGVDAGQTVADLPIAPEDRSVLQEEITHGRAADDGRVRVLRLRLDAQPLPILIRIVHDIAGNADHVGLVTTVLAWPESLTAMLKSSFELTASESEVLKHLALGFSVSEVAKATRRSDATIRSHVASLLDKTSTRSQIELVRLTLGFLDVVENPALAPASGVPGRRLSLTDNTYQTFRLSDGRRLDYLSIGDPRGEPFMLLPSDIGLTRLMPEAERALEERALRMIVPVRAGYGGSSPIPKGRHVHDVAHSDTLELMAQLGILRWPLWSLGSDIRIAVEIACRAPTRVSAIIGCGAELPARTKAHYQRMNKWARFVAANARYAPRAMSYIALAFFGLARRIGQKRFVKLVMGSSPPDLKMIEDEDVYAAMLRGSEISVSPSFTAHEAWTAEIIAALSQDWSDRLRQCPVPIKLFHGIEDPFSPIATVREYAAAIPNITLVEIADRGQILYREWPLVFHEIEKRLGRQV
jgi:pimeloyl-ACP methyl ester carboxylesterase/DNA-binding CsgD family transcriptional regulator